MSARVLVCLAGLLVDPRTLTGAPIWAKPLKFSISVLIYAITLAWLLRSDQHCLLGARRRRLAWWIGTVSTIALASEMVIIVGAAGAGTTSHFTVSSPLATTLWSVMAFMIVIVWMLALVTAVQLFRTDLGDPARSLAIRAGTIVAVIGMGLAFLMTGPTAAQLGSFQGIAGAHFVGMHALQMIPLALLLVELASARVPLLRSSATRLRLIWIVISVYLGVLAILTGQALAGQSIVQPGLVVMTLGAILVAAAAVALLAVLLAARPAEPQPRLPHQRQGDSAHSDAGSSTWRSFSSVHRRRDQRRPSDLYLAAVPWPKTATSGCGTVVPSAPARVVSSSERSAIEASGPIAAISDPKGVPAIPRASSRGVGQRTVRCSRMAETRSKPPPVSAAATPSVVMESVPPAIIRANGESDRCRRTAVA